jgi:hypothetical protein
MDRKTKMFLICGALAGPLFTIAWFVEGFLHANYDSMRHAVSSLSVGEFGWMQDANFILTGLLTLALALGVWSTLGSRSGSVWGPTLLVAAAIGFIGSGFFTTDPLNGYPPGTAVLPIPPTRSGWLHLFFAALIFGLPAAGFVLARHFDGLDEHQWSMYSRVSAIIFIILYLVTIAGFLQADGVVDYAGLLQRVSLTIILLWMTLLPIHLLQSSSNSQDMGRN